MCECVQEFVIDRDHFATEKAAAFEEAKAFAVTQFAEL